MDKSIDKNMDKNNELTEDGIKDNIKDTNDIDTSYIDNKNNNQDNNNDIIHLISKRLDLGKERYGVGMRIDNTKYDWEKEALEELLDGMIYITTRLLQIRSNRNNSNEL